MLTVREFFDSGGVEYVGCVKWGQEVPSETSGIYLVSTAASPDAPNDVAAPFQSNPSALVELLRVCPDMTVDGVQATVASVSQRLSEFWIPSATVLYVGLAGSSLRERVWQFYTTRIGKPSPHAGGWWLKCLDNLENLYVHFGETENCKTAEQQIIDSFAAGLDSVTSAALFDSYRLAPFANVAVSPGKFKVHGMKNYKESRGRTASRSQGTRQTLPISNQPRHMAPVVSSGTENHEPSEFSTTVESQVITLSDRNRGVLRIPSRSKFALPPANGYVSFVREVEIREVRWRVNGARSGTLGLGKAAMQGIGVTNSPVWLNVSGTRISLTA